MATPGTAYSSPTIELPLGALFAHHEADGTLRGDVDGLLDAAGEAAAITDDDVAGEGGLVACPRPRRTGRRQSPAYMIGTGVGSGPVTDLPSMSAEGRAVAAGEIDEGVAC